MNYKVIWQSFDNKLALTACNTVLFKRGGQWYSTNSQKWLARIASMRESEETERAIEHRRERRHAP